MPSETHAEKVPHVTFGIQKNKVLSAVAKHSNSSRIRAHAKRNARRKSASRDFWNQKTIFCPQMRNTRTAAGFEHMPSKTHAEKVPHVTFWIYKKQSFVCSCETLEQQQDWCPHHTKHKPEKCRASPKERIKKLAGSMPKPCEIWSKSRWKTVGKNDLEKRFRNSGTAAGLMPTPYETQARKEPNVT